MVKKESRIKNKLDLPVLKSGINPGHLVLTLEPAPYLLFQGSGAIAREFYEKDMLRLKETLKIGRIEPKLAMAGSDLHSQLKSRIDPKTGNADIAVLLPKNVKIPSPAVSDDLPILKAPVSERKKTF